MFGILLAGGEAAGILAFLIALGVCILIGVAAAFERVALYDFAIVVGVWFAIYLFVRVPLWIAVVNFIVYCIVTIGTMLIWGGQ